MSELRNLRAYIVKRVMEKNDLCARREAARSTGRQVAQFNLTPDAVSSGTTGIRRLGAEDAADGAAEDRRSQGLPMTTGMVAV